MYTVFEQKIFIRALTLKFLEYAERRCSSEGTWEGKPGGTSVGWTNYTPCFSPEVVQLFRKLYANGNEDDAKVHGIKPI